MSHTLPLERQTFAVWIRDALADEEEAVNTSHRRTYGKFLLDLLQESLDDETYLTICRETGRIWDLIERLLTRGRVDDAVKATQQVTESTFLELSDLFIQHGHDTIAEQLVRARLGEPSDGHSLDCSSAIIESQRQSSRRMQYG